MIGRGTFSEQEVVIGNTYNSQTILIEQTEIKIKKIKNDLNLCMKIILFTDICFY